MLAPEDCYKRFCIRIEHDLVHIFSIFLDATPKVVKNAFG